MNDQLPYRPDVYRRLDLVSKQFKRNSSDLKSLQAIEKRRRLADGLRQNKQGIIRWAVYIFLALLVLAVLGIVIINAIKS